MSDLHVTGGLGGIEVAVDELRAASARLVRAADHIETEAGPDWDLGAWMVAAVAHSVAARVGHARSESSQLRRRVRAAAEQLRQVAAATRRVADAYERAEADVARLTATLHGQAMAVAWALSEAAARYGLLSEGEGWSVTLDRVAAPECVPTPRSVDGLLAGIGSLGGPGSQGHVRVLEVPAADGTTTWVVQVPGTHGGWTEGGEVPMDWPANVALMLRATSASRLAAERALDLAQGGRAGPRDQVVIAGHSQGGIVAAALASDPAFTSRHRVTHVVTAGSPIDQFPIPASTEVLSLQHDTDPVHGVDVSLPPDRRHWTTVRATARIDPTAHLVFGAHALATYRATAQRVDHSNDVSLRQWRAGLAPALTPASGAQPTVHEFRARRRWQNRPP